MWMLPEYRQLRAAPTLLMKVMEELCDKHDVEGYGEFVQMSQRLGVKCGFELKSKVCFKMNIENPTKESQELIDDFQSEPMYLMIRPKKSSLKNTPRPAL